MVASISANHVNTPESYVAAMRVRGIWRIGGKNYLEISKSMHSNNTYPTIYSLYLIGDGVTSLSKVIEFETEGEADNRIFDISGQQLSEKPAEGVYIQGGKKYVAQ